MRPWLAALVVETYDSLSAGLQTEYGTEAQLQNVFLKKKGGRVVGLETLAEQMRAFTGLTLAEQREMLAQDIAQTPAQNADDIKALHRLWRIGDADAVSPPGPTPRPSGSRIRGRWRRRSTTRSSTSATAASPRARSRWRARTGRCSWRSARCIWAAPKV